MFTCAVCDVRTMFVCGHTQEINEVVQKIAGADQPVSIWGDDVQQPVVRPMLYSIQFNLKVNIFNSTPIHSQSHDVISSSSGHPDHSDDTDEQRRSSGDESHQTGSE